MHCYKSLSNKLEKNTFNVDNCRIIIKATVEYLTLVTTFTFVAAQRCFRGKRCI